jgi:gas vesicle protein
MSTGNTVLGFVAGAAIGAIAGILYAPAKGSETREKLREGLDDIKNNLQDKFENATQDLKGQISDAKFDLEETYENLVSTMSHKAEDVIAFLETKLADLKAQNAKFQKEHKTQYSE